MIVQNVYTRVVVESDRQGQFLSFFFFGCADLIGKELI